MTRNRNIASVAQRIVAFMKWVARPEKLTPPEVSRKSAEGRSLWRWLLWPQALPEAPAQASRAPALGLFRRVFSPETLAQDGSGDKVARPSLLAWLFSVERLPGEGTGEEATRPSLPAWLFSWEDLASDVQAAAGGGHPGFVRNLLAVEALPRDEREAPRPPSLLRWMVGREKLGVDEGVSGQKRSTANKEG